MGNEVIPGARATPQAPGLQFGVGSDSLDWPERTALPRTCGVAVSKPPTTEMHQKQNHDIELKS